MTIEELDIIVSASIEPALKEIKRLMPQIKQQVTQAVEVAQKSMEQVDMKKVSNKIQQSVQQIKAKIEKLKKSSKNSDIEIKVNNKEAQKQISQIQKQIDSLQEKINARQIKLDIIRPKLDAIQEQPMNKVIPERLVTNKEYIGLSDKETQLIQEIKLYYNQIDKAKAKMSQLKQEVAQTSTSQNKLTSFFSMFKQKISQVKPMISNMKKSFGQMPNMTQKITNSIKIMGKSTKQGLSHIFKYAGALFSLRGIYSVLSNSAQSWLSSQNSGAQQLSTNIEYMKYAMGSVFAPVIEYVINLVYQLMKAIQSVVYAFSGINIFAKATASSMNKTANGASKASKSLTGVHNEINNVSEIDNSGGSGSVSPSMDLSKVENTSNSIIDAIKNGNWYQLGETIGQKLNQAMKSIPWDKIQNTARNIGKNIAETLNGFISTTDWKQVGSTFAQGINTIIYCGYEFVTTFDWKNFGRAIGDSINGFFKNIDWSTLGQTLSLKISGVFNTISGFFETLDWSIIVKGLLDFINSFDWKKVSNSIFTALGAACASIVNLGMVIGEYLSQALDNMKRFFTNKIEEAGGNIVLGIFEGILEALGSLGQWIIDNIFTPFIEGFKNVFGIHSPSTVMAEQGKFIIQGLLNGITSLLDKVKQIWEIIKNVAIEKFTNIKSFISDTCNRIKETVSIWCINIGNFFSNLWQNICNIFSNVGQWFYNKFNSAVQGIRNAFSSIGTFFGGVWQGICNTFGNVANWFKDKFSQAWQAVKNVFSSGGKIFDGVKDGILSGLKSIVNAIITGINKVISIPFKGLNSALRSIRNVNILGLQPFSWISTIQVPQIPKLAKGGVIDNPTIAMMGEYSGAKTNPEIVTPQNIMYDTMVRALSDTDFNNGNNGQSIYLTVNVGNERLGRILLNDLRNMTRQTGQGIEALVGG